MPETEELPVKPVLSVESLLAEIAAVKELNTELGITCGMLNRKIDKLRADLTNETRVRDEEVLRINDTIIMLHDKIKKLDTPPEG